MIPRITLRAVSLSYPSSVGDNGGLLAVTNVSFSIAPGEFVCLVGPSGSGKSTLIRVIAGLHLPTRGQVLLDNMPITTPTRRIALMFQEANLLPWRTVTDNIVLPLELAGEPREAREQAAARLLPRLGLQEFSRAYPAELSGGMAQRVALGRVLIQRPDVLLLDEPFGALDAMTRERVSADLLELWLQEKPAVLMVTHDINEAVMLADRVLVMSSRPGQIIADIPVLLSRPRDQYDPVFGQIARQVRGLIERA
ncbi:ABC transporter ATP-binding protein [Anaerolineae bacterium CFX9]|jgi:NitT/TauT family transport system ATP-binding protein|nr:ABC transporter ATP-binding protein [Anaerolineae bacterium CFX9]